MWFSLPPQQRPEVSSVLTGPFGRAIEGSGIGDLSSPILDSGRGKGLLPGVVLAAGILRILGLEALEQLLWTWRGRGNHVPASNCKDTAAGWGGVARALVEGRQ